MITERLTFQAKYGQGDALVAVMKDSFKVMPSEGVLAARVLTDFTGKMFTCVFELDYADLNSWSKASQADMADYGTSQFQEWFAKMVACTDGGDRQIFNSEKIL